MKEILTLCEPGMVLTAEHVKLWLPTHLESSIILLLLILFCGKLSIIVPLHVMVGGGEPSAIHVMLVSTPYWPFESGSGLMVTF